MFSVFIHPFEPFLEIYYMESRDMEGGNGGEGSRTPVLRRHSGNVYMCVLPLVFIVAPRAGKRASLRLSCLKSRSTAAEKP